MPLFLEHVIVLDLAVDKRTVFVRNQTLRLAITLLPVHLLLLVISLLVFVTQRKVVVWLYPTFKVSVALLFLSNWNVVKTA